MIVYFGALQMKVLTKNTTNLVAIFIFEGQSHFVTWDTNYVPVTRSGVRKR